MIRHLLVATALVASLAACQSTTPVDVQTIANDVVQIDTGAQNALSQASVQALIPAATLPKVQAALADLDTVAKAMIANPSSAVTKGNVQVVVSDLETLTSAAAGVVPPPYSTYLEAASIFLPVIQVAIGIAAPAAASTSGHDLAWARANVGPALHH